MECRRAPRARVSSARPRGARGRRRASAARAPRERRAAPAAGGRGSSADREADQAALLTSLDELQATQDAGFADMKAEFAVLRATLVSGGGGGILASLEARYGNGEGGGNKKKKGKRKKTSDNGPSEEEFAAAQARLGGVVGESVRRHRCATSSRRASSRPSGERCGEPPRNCPRCWR